MKKLLSLVLALALLVSCVAVIPAISTSAAEASALSEDTKDVYTEIFNSNNYTGNINSDIVTDTDKGLWTSEGWIGSTGDRIYLNRNGNQNSTGALLERNQMSTQSVGDFEWQFQFIANSNQYANASFCFHVNDNSDVSAYGSRKNVFAVTLYGSDYASSKANYYVPSALVIEYPNASGAMRPYKYDTSVSPWLTDPESYIKLDEATESAPNTIVLNKFCTINIKMVGGKITVAVWQTSDKEGTYREHSVTISNMTFFDNADRGDFAIVAGGTNVMEDGETYLAESNTNIGIKDMTIKKSSLLFDSNAYNGIWLTQNPGNSELVYETTKTVGEMSVASNTYLMPKYAATDEILESAFDGEEVNLTDFVWQTEYSVHNTEANANYTGLSFNFHVDKDRTDTASLIPGDTGAATSLNNRKYMMSATVYGSAMTEMSDAANASSLVLQSSTTGGTGYVYAADFVNLTKTNSDVTYRYARSAVETSENIVKDTWYTVRIVLSGNNLYAYTWKTADKDNTLRCVYHKLTDAQLAAAQSGDFAIVNNYRIVNIRNMKIWDNVDVIRSDEDYSEYTDILPATTYDFENGLNDANFGLGELYEDAPDAETDIMTFEIVEEEDGNKRLQAGSQSDNKRIRIDNLDGYNENLADFIITTELEVEKKTSNWYNDQIVFRATDSNNYYAVELRRRARVNAVTETNDYYLYHDYIALTKRTSEGTVTLAEASLSRSYEAGRNYKIKLAAIGDSIKVWFAEDDMFTQPVISCVDSTFSTGFMYIFHSVDTVAYFDNINIYDITATELAADLGNIDIESITRETKADTDALADRFNGMDKNQQTKLATLKVTLDAALAKQLELEEIAHDINADGEINAIDIVVLKKYIAGAREIDNTDADPLLGDGLNAQDLTKLRDWFM